MTPRRATLFIAALAAFVLVAWFWIRPGAPREEPRGEAAPEAASATAADASRTRADRRASPGSAESASSPASLRPVSASSAAAPGSATKTALAKAPAKGATSNAAFEKALAAARASGVSLPADLKPPAPPADAGVVFGVVKGKDGRPDAGATVTVWSGEPDKGAAAKARAALGGGPRGSLSSEGEVGEDGSYRVEGVAPGQATVQVESARFANPDPVTIEVGPEEEHRQDFELEAGDAIAGHVRDGQGAPLAGIEVASMYPKRKAVTDEAGAYRVEGLDKRMPQAMLTATDPEGRYAKATRAAKHGDTAADFALEAAARLEVIVLSAATREPVEGAGVSDATPSGNMFARWGAAAADATTDASGRAVLQGLAPGANRKIRAEKAGAFAPSEVRIDLAPGATQEVEILLGAGATVRGHVRDPQGRPLSPALVVGEVGAMGTFMSPDRVVDSMSANLEAATATRTAAWLASPLAGTAATLTDAEGAYELAHIQVGKRTIAAGHRDFVGASQTISVDADGDVVDLDFTLAAGGAVEGKALDKDGKPAAGARISVYSMLGSGKNVVVGDDGTYRVSGLRGGTYMGMMTPSDGVVVKVGGGMPDTKSVQVEEGKTARLDFGVGAEGATVSGRVRRGGKAYAGSVTLVPAASAGASWIGMKQARTDEQGRYRIEGVAAGDYVVRIEPTYLLRLRIGDAPEVEQNYDLPSMELPGVVVDEAGRPIAGAQVKVVRAEDRANPMYAWLSVTVTTGDDGSFTAGDLDDASYSVEATKAGYAAARKTVSSGASSPVTLTLPKGGRIRGRVVGPEGDPILGAIGIATDEATGETRTSNVEMWTGTAPGEFAIDGLLPGRSYTVAAVAFRGGFDRRAGVKVDAEGETALDFTIGPGGTLALTARGADGAPAGGAAVRLAYPDGKPLPSSFFEALQASVTSPGGAYRREHLPPGEYRATVTAADGRSATVGFKIREEEEAAVPVTLP